VNASGKKRRELRRGKLIPLLGIERGKEKKKRGENEDSFGSGSGPGGKRGE